MPTSVPLLMLYLCLNFHPPLRKRTPTYSSSPTQMIFLKKKKKKKHWRDFPGGPVVKASGFLCRRLGNSPWSLKTSHAHAARSSQEKKKKKHQTRAPSRIQLSSGAKVLLTLTSTITSARLCYIYSRLVSIWTVLSICQELCNKEMFVYTKNELMNL